MCTNAQMSSLSYSFCSSMHAVGGPQEGIVTISSWARLMASLACWQASFICWSWSVTDEDVETWVSWCMRGKCLMMSSNGVFFVVAFGQELWVYCAKGSQCAQLFCWKLLKIQRYCLSHWLVRSDWPSVYGWYAVLIFCSTWKSLQSSCEKVEVKQGSWSDMIHDGSP